MPPTKSKRKPKINKAAADKAVDFIESLKHVKGEYAGLPFILEKWQKDDIIRPLFGTLNPDGFRQYRKAYLTVARKNGKSEMAAAIALYLLFADKEPGAEIYGAATDREQAGIVYSVAKRMVEASPELMRRSKIIDSKKRIVVPRTGSFYTAVSKEVMSKHGYDASGIVFDELHAQKDRELWDVLTTSTGSRRQPLIVAVTTAGYDRQSICYEEYSYAKKVLKGDVIDPTYFAYIREIGPRDSWKNEKNWHKANPALKTFRKIEEMRSAFKKALTTPAFQNTFIRLYLNRWTQNVSRWIDIDKWDRCGGTVDAKKLAGRTCYGGLDLASSIDIAAFVLVFPPEKDGGRFDILCRFWIPRENMIERVKKDRVQYNVWADEKYITPTPGNVIDYARIEADILKDSETFDIKEAGFDRWGAIQLVQNLEGENMTMVPMGQGYKTMSPPTKQLIPLTLNKKINHGGNPVLTWMAENMVIETDPAENMKPSKKQSTEKIDGMVALIMALDRALRHDESAGRSVYDTEDLKTI